MKHYWAVIPAAGVGKRMQAQCPKQYLELGKKTIIEHTLDVFFSNSKIEGVVVALGADDPYWSQLNLSPEKPLYLVDGGSQRCDSVLNALLFLQEMTRQNDWVLVHDAARPCLSQKDLNRIIAEGSHSEDGALLAAPCRDTMKLGDEGGVVRDTVDRSTLWHALTPQMFPLEKLIAALVRAQELGVRVTDDCMAIEKMGGHPLLVEGSSDNLKITRPEDLAMAEMILSRRE